MTHQPESEDWGDHSFEGARRYHLAVNMAVTPAERLAWLEDLIEFAYQAGALPRKRPHP